MSLSAGTRIGPYEIVSPLGAGGMGEVYRARDPRLGRQVAIKILPRLADASSMKLQRFEREARATGALNHPNILAIYDIGVHEGLPYLVSELLEGETLLARLRHGPLPQHKAIEFGKQIVAGLAAAHARGIVHRDLKPENIFLTKDGVIKILDFGLAKWFGEPGDSRPGLKTAAPQTEAGVLVGTVSYMSPEQIRGEDLDHRSDIFAFGLVLYEMLAGIRAFDGKSAAETIAATLYQEPPEFPESSHPSLQVEQIVRHCLEKKPDDRYQSARDLQFQLDALTGVLVSATRQRSGRFGLPPRRLRSAAIAAAFLALGAVTAFLAARLLGQTPLPTYQQLTYRRGAVLHARQAPDGGTIVYSASWDGLPPQLYSVRTDSPESRPFDLPSADILSISPSGELAISIDTQRIVGWLTESTLARVPLGGGAPRPVLDRVVDADWSPDGSELAVVHGDANGYRLEFPIGTVLYRSAGWLSNPRVALHGRRIAFVEHPVMGDDAGQICVVGPGEAMRVLSAGWASVSGLAWSPNGDEIWFSASDRRPTTDLFAVTLSGRQRVLQRSPSRMALLDVDSKTGRALVSAGRLRIGAIYLEPGKGTERDLSWQDVSIATDLANDGRTMLFLEIGTAESSLVYQRPTDGAPAVRLGAGTSPVLSPDERWVATLGPEKQPAVVLLPVGPGQSRKLPLPSLEAVQHVEWFPDGRRLLLNGNEAGHGPRLFALDIEQGKTRAISAEGVRLPLFAAHSLSPDGRQAALLDSKGIPVLLSLDGGAVQTLRGLQPGDQVARWSPDGKALYVYHPAGMPGHLYRYDLATGTATTLVTLEPRDRAGMGNLTSVQILPDAQALVYSYSVNLSDLFLVDHLK
ncbi:MAG: protein kinase domain-containing protein [Acidobacteriota bacterium]